MTPCQLLKSSGLDVFYVEVWGSKCVQDFVILYQSTRSHISLQLNINIILPKSLEVQRNVLLFVIMERGVFALYLISVHVYECI